MSLLVINLFQPFVYSFFFFFGKKQMVEIAEIVCEIFSSIFIIVHPAGMGQSKVPALITSLFIDIFRTIQGT